MRAEAVDRIRLVFTLFDADGNGVLEDADFELMANRVLEAATGSDDADKAAMLAAFRGYWAVLSDNLDADHDRRITFEEYQACVLSPELFDEAIGEFADALAKLGNPRGDGLVARSVFMPLMTAIGFEPANSDALFDAFGPDASDQIEAETWVTGIKDFYHPDKAGIPGDHLVGRPAA